MKQLVSSLIWSRKVWRNRVSHKFGFLERQFGRLRWALGLVILEIYFRFRRKNTITLMQNSARLVQRFSFLYKGRSRFSNNFKCRWQDFAFNEVLRRVKFYYPNFVIPITLIAEPSVKSEMCNGSGGLILTTHTNLKSVFSRLFEDLGIESSTIRKYEGGAKTWAKRLGLKSEPRFIRKNSNALLETRRRVSLGEFVVNSVDYLDYTISAKPNLCISPTMFIFASKLKIRTYFALPRFSDTGELAIIVERAPEGSIESGLESFRSFNEKYSGIVKNWSFKVETAA